MSADIFDLGLINTLKEEKKLIIKEFNGLLSVYEEIEIKNIQLNNDLFRCLYENGYNDYKIKKLLNKDFINEQTENNQVLSSENNLNSIEKTVFHDESVINNKTRIRPVNYEQEYFLNNVSCQTSNILSETRINTSNFHKKIDIVSIKNPALCCCLFNKNLSNCGKCSMLKINWLYEIMEKSNVPILKKADLNFLDDISNILPSRKSLQYKNINIPKNTNLKEISNLNTLAPSKKPDSMEIQFNDLTTLKKLNKKIYKRKKFKYNLPNNSKKSKNLSSTIESSISLHENTIRITDNSIGKKYFADKKNGAKIHKNSIPKSGTVYDASLKKDNFVVKKTVDSSFLKTKLPKKYIKGRNFLFVFHLKKTRVLEK
uniref:Uncharacterized protein n=1 Tax=Tetracapsuloides bryosalmonae TaxID=271932 RepID=A0A859IQM6_9CNID|nr:P4C10 hypothetical protein [Tetracapsuloides bryosalmonae]